MELDTTSGHLVLDCFAVFITIHQWKDIESRREISCLLLRRCDKKGRKLNHLGTLGLYNFYGLKTRFRIHGIIDEDEWEGMQKRIKFAQDSILEAKWKRTQEEGRDQSETDADDATNRIV